MEVPIPIKPDGNSPLVFINISVEIQVYVKIQISVKIQVFVISVKNSLLCQVFD